MKTGNIIEAMEAAKNGARVRMLSSAYWWKWDRSGGSLVSDDGCGAFGHFSEDMITSTWEIYDLPRRWPSIVEAVKHMQDTGDLGRPCGGTWPWYRFKYANGPLVSAENDDFPGIGADGYAGPWETKPAD